MKHVLPALAAVGALAVAVPAAAQAWLPINARQAILDARIDQGVRARTLTATEAARLRTEFRNIAALEARYRATGGFQEWERKDLDARFDRLSAGIRIQTADNQRAGSNGSWQSINQRQAALDRRIDNGVREGTVSRAEAIRLRSEFRQIAAIEQRYRANGLQTWERADLDKRFDRLSAQIRTERADYNNRPGVGANAGYRR